MSAISPPNDAIAALLFAALCAAPFGAVADTCNIIDGRAYGDCTNVNVNTEPRASLDVRGNVSESGLIAGAQIRRGASLELLGMSTGDITLEPGATLLLRGTVNGSIINNGGTVTVHGMARTIVNNAGTVEVFGIVDRVVGDGKVRFAKGSVVAGKPVN